MKFLFFGDHHNRLTAPENRLDDFTEAMRAKRAEIIDIGKKHGVSAFLQPGDFWDTPNPPLDYASDVIHQWSNVNVFNLLQNLTSKRKIDTDLFVSEYLRKLVNGEFVDIDEARRSLEAEFTEEDLMKEKQLLEDRLKDYIPMIGVAGNHDLFGNNIKTLPKTMLGFMEKLGLMTFATKENPYYFYTEDGLKIAITGTHYHLDVDSPEYINDYVVEEKLGDYHIHIVHGYLTDKSKGNIFRHTIIDQMKHTKADLTLAGHDHIGFPLTEIDGKYFVNTGAIPRLSNDLKEINRQIKVLLIDISKEKGLVLKEVPLKSANEGSIVLNRTKIVEKKKKQERLEEFKKAVRDAGVKKATDITEIVRDIADNKSLPAEIKEETVKRISEKMSLMKDSGDSSVKEAYVNKIVLENFQSHEFTELNFSKGFNIFVGESKQGKTSVLRAFRWVYDNKPTGKRLIRKGADYARVTVYLSNGYIISRYVEAKRSGKNGYEITDPSTGEVAFHNTKILPEVQKILGFTSLVIDKDLQFDLNFLKQGTGWFLIGDQYSSPQKAKIIGGIYGTQFADAVIRDIDSETKRTNEKVKVANEVLLKTENRLKEFDYLPDLEKSIKFIEIKVKEIEELKLKKEKISKLLDKRDVITKNIQENEKSLEALKDLDATYNILSETKDNLNKRNRLEELLEKHKDTSYSLKHLYRSLQAVKQLDNAKEELTLTMELLSKRNNIEKVVVRREDITKNIDLQDMVIKKTENIKIAEDLVEETSKQVERRSKIETLLVKRFDYAKNLKENAVLVEKTNELENAKELLLEVNRGLSTRKELEEKSLRAKELEEKRKNTQKSLEEIHKSEENTKQVEEAIAQMEEVKAFYQKREGIEKLLLSRDKIVSNIKQEDLTIKKAKEAIDKDIKTYQEVLEKAGTCPVCFGTIDNATINQIVHEHVK